MADPVDGKPFTFVRGYNSFTDEYGWKPEHLPHFDPVGPAMVLHDLLEHFPEGDEQVHWEYQALGAAFFVRGSNYYFGDGGIIKALSEKAFTMLFHHILKNDLPCEVPSYRDPSHSKPLDLDVVEMDMQETIIAARKILLPRFKYDSRKNRIDDTLKYALPWMRLGYHKATERYLEVGIDAYALGEMFTNAQTRIEAISENLTENEERLTIILDFLRGRSKIVVEFPYV